MNSPLLFIIDLDGTIIGNCAYQVCAYSVENVIKKNKQRCNSTLQSCYASRLVRPFFKSFYDSMMRAHPNSLFYVYTASEKDWAIKEIAMIEKEHSVKFDRPIFARNDCIVNKEGHYRKSVAHILPRIKKKNKGIDIKDDMIMVIDNNRVFEDYKDNFVLCPTYDHTSFFDIWSMIRPEHLKSADIVQAIADLRSNGMMCKFSEMQSSSDKVLEMKHKWLYRRHKKLNKQNTKFADDTFWKDLATLMLSNRAPIDRRYTSYIAKSLLDKKVDIA